MTIQTFTYPNGFRLIYEKSNYALHTSIIQAFCDVGSIHEPNELKGAAHFIEHMCFKGTKTIPDFKKIYAKYDEIGAYINATTEKRHTRYIVKCNTEYISGILSILSDMMLHSVFDKTTFKREERVVNEENVMSNTDVTSKLFDGLDALLYEGTEYSRPTDNLTFHDKPFRHSDITDFYKKFYQPNRMVVSIVSNKPYDQIKKYMEQTGFVHDANAYTIYPNVHGCLKPSSGIKYNILKAQGTYASIGFRVEPQDKHELICLNAILDGPMSARLFKVLRDEHGLTYSAGAECTMYDVHGDFIIYSDIEASKLLVKPGLLPLMIDMINDLIQNGVSQSEVNMAKGYLYGQMMRTSENELEVARYNGEQTILFPNEPVISYSLLYNKFYKNIDKSDIDRVIAKYFRKELMSVCIVSEKSQNLGTVKTICERIK